MRDRVPTTDIAPDMHARILAAAGTLITAGGREALTTRAVAAAAGVQAPTIYRLFHDKQGLLDAVAERGFTAYIQQKQRAGTTADPVDDLRQGWDLHVGFGLANPAIFAVMYGESRPGEPSPAASVALSMLRERMRTLAIAGRLRIDEFRAADMLRAAACGVVFVLLETPETQRDLGLSEVTREAIIRAITADAPEHQEVPLASVATTLRALLPHADGLTDGERQLLAEWLIRISRFRAG